MATSIDLAALANLIQAQTTAIADFTDQQILLYTTTDPTVVVSDANGNPVTVPSWYATVGDNKAAVDAMQAQVTANTAAIAAINNGDTTINATISAIQTQQATNVSDIATLKAQMTTVQTNQSTDEGSIATLQAQVASIQSGGSGNTSAITDLQSTVAGHTTAITALQAQQSTNTSNITSLQSTTSNQATTIGALQDQQTTNTNTIASHTTSIGTINDQIAAIQTNQQTHDNAITTNTTNIATNTTALGTVQAALATNTTAISTIEGNISTLQTAQASNSTALGNVQTDMSTLQTQQATLQTTSTQNSTDITDIRTTIATLPLPGAYNPPYVSNRFFTQVFMDVNGRLLGGISRRSGKLWLNNGGWLSDRLDTLEASASLDNVVYFSEDSGTQINAPATRRWGQVIGQKAPRSIYDGQNGTVLTNVTAGFRADTGALELVDGTNVLTLAQQCAERLPPATWNAAGKKRVVLADSTDFATVSNAQVVVAAPGMTSSQVAARVAAPAILLSVTNRKILAAGATTVTASKAINGSDALVDAPLITAASQATTLKGKLGNVPGTLTRGASDTDVTFTPSVTLGADVYVGDNLAFIPEDATSLLNNTVIIAIGRNNLSDLPAVKRDIQAIIAALPGREKHFVVVTPYAGASDNSASANGLAVIALEQWAASNYPHNHFLTRQFLQNTYAALGAGDAATFFSSGEVPTSYYTADNVTLTATAKGYISAAVSNLLQQRGW